MIVFKARITKSLISLDGCVGWSAPLMFANPEDRVLHQGPCTVKPVLNGHLKIDKTKVLMENGSLMKVESIAEWVFCNSYDLH